MIEPDVRGLADQELAGYIEQLRAHPGASARALGATGLRESSAQRAAARPPGPDLAFVEDLNGDNGVPVRLYRPCLEPRPLLVYFHGGGWTLGDLASHDRLCRLLSHVADVAVLAVDYRRAPENPWPAAVEDAVDAVHWARREALKLVGTTVIGVGGDSAGGNIATLACLELRDAGEQLPDAQVLAYPNTDLTFSQPSVATKAAGWGLEADDAHWFAEQWVPELAKRHDPRVSPLLEPDLAGLPRAVIVTAEHDPLRDEGDAYAAALRAAGVQVTWRCEPGLIHGFLGLDLVSPAAGRAVERLCQDVRSALGVAAGSPRP
ncbi:MAG TPA: alpha/beta hydrolase [Mycobacteriales bacterium]|nr:alpha/beta hydrolase [Mycobacteriales bacterium]